MMQNSPGLLFLIIPLGHQELFNQRLRPLKKNDSKESGEVQLQKSVKTTDYDPESQSTVKKFPTL